MLVEKKVIKMNKQMRFSIHQKWKKQMMNKIFDLITFDDFIIFYIGSSKILQTELDLDNYFLNKVNKILKSS